MAPWDRELALGFAHLRARGFVPPPIRELPAASAAARTFASWQPEDRAALAAELVTLPEPAEAGQLGQTDRAWAALELLLRVPGEAERARQLIGKLEARLDPRGSSEARSKLAVAPAALEDGTAKVWMVYFHIDTRTGGLQAWAGWVHRSDWSVVSTDGKYSRIVLKTPAREWVNVRSWRDIQNILPGDNPDIVCGF